MRLNSAAYSDARASAVLCIGRRAARAGGCGRWTAQFQQESWAGLKNGELLTQAEDSGFSVFVTGDQNLAFQQNISKRRLGVVVLCAASNALEDLLPLVPAALTAIATVRPGQLVRVEA